MEVDVNYIAVLLAAVSNMVIGFVWYGPMLFAKRWVKAMGTTMAEMEKRSKNMGPMYALTFVGALVIAYVLSHVMTFSMAYLKESPLTTGLMTAFWMWLGFMVPVQMNEVIFGGKKWELFAINTGYQLVSLLAMGVILGLMS